MDYAVLKAAGYVLAHTPSMLVSAGTTQTSERIVNPGSEYLTKLNEHLRTFEEAVSYPPNQVYIGNISPAELKAVEAPWHDKQTPGATRFGRLGEIMPEDELIGLMEIVDTFDLVKLTEAFADDVKKKLEKHPLFAQEAAKIKAGEPLEAIKKLVDEQHATPLYIGDAIVGCVKAAHDIDPNLNSHVIFENLAAKATGTLAFKNLIAKNNLDPTIVDYVIECSEEACGDMNQRGGGNFAKSIAEMAGAVNATGSDTRGFCAAPTHALIQAASLVKAGSFKNVVVVAGGAVAKLGMNGKDHVKKGIPLIEDVLGGFAVLISENDGVSPFMNTDLIGRHTVGTGSSPQAVITSLVAKPLEKGSLKFTDIDKYSVEMQNPDITKPAGAGDVPEANYKMIAALAVMRKEIERTGIQAFIDNHGMPGWAPTQGHIPSGVPYIGFAIKELTEGNLNRCMIVGKGSLFLGRMTNLFDGVSIVIERNNGAAESEEAPESAPAAVSDEKRVKIGITQLGSEHGVSNIVEGARIAARNASYDIVLIGPEDIPGFECVKASDETEMYKKMEQLLDSGYIGGCVTMHYSFPLGVATVGRVVTPAKGNEMFIATTTGTASTNRVEAMVKNAVSGIATAKSLGIKKPTVGILNVDGAKQVEKILLELKKNGYAIEFSESVRADGGAVMRGNDALCGSADVMVTDSLTGNVLMKMFSSFMTGGSYEATGFGYGPGVGSDYKRLILILSRASGAAVVANSLAYAAELAKGGVLKLAAAEFAAANKCGLNGMLQELHKEAVSETVSAPPKEVVTEEIPGVDIMCLDDAVQALWKEGLYAESGMGCTGPVVLVNDAKHGQALEILKKCGFLNE